jgi:amino acid adenylation domain-containing protein
MICVHKPGKMANRHTDNSFLAGGTVVNLLQSQVQQRPQQRAFTFLADGETESRILTYEDLDRCSRAIALALQQRGLTGQRALLLYPPGLDYLTAFFGCLYAGVVAVPAYPPRNKRNTPRIVAVVEDAEAAIALTTTQIATKAQSLLGQYTEIDVLEWLTTDNLPSGNEDQWQPPALNTDSLAFLQYTSGSTGTPKGVMVTHGNLLHNAAMTYRYMGHSPESVFVSWLPTYHDMGLIGGILQPLYGGFSCILMPPAIFLQRPYLWLQAISRYGGTTSGAPNFAYDLCVQKVTPEQQETLDLSSWDVAFNGAEPIRYETLERFADYFAPCGFRREAFYPCYGMAEATLMVTGVEKAKAPKVKTVNKEILEQNRVEASADSEAVTLVSCGHSLSDQTVVIANPETRTRCAAGEVGEVWVSGASVGQGYWNRPDATQKTFHAYLEDTGEGPFLRTGDLGFLEDGELYITGRAKDLIIIRGRNLYPQDIERTVEESHEDLRKTGGAAFSVEVEGEEGLVIVQELEFRRKPNLDEVIQAIRQRVVAEHEIQAYGVVLIKGGTIPKTSSGKIQRRACRTQFLAGELAVQKCDVLEVVAPPEVEALSREMLLSLPREQRQPRLEQYLQQRIAAGLRQPITGIDWQQPLIGLGLDSLRVFQLKNSVETDLGVEIAIADLFSEISLSALTQNLLTQVTDTASTVVPLQRCETQASYPLSDAQQRLWFFERLQPHSSLYNIAGVLHLAGKLDINALERSLHALIRRHYSLRTAFTVENGEARQVIVDAVSVSLAVQEIRDNELREVMSQEAQIPFDLSIAPLIRVKLLQVSPTQHSLLVVIHHIVADGWSMGIFLQELMALYQGFVEGKAVTLPELPIQYVDYAVARSRRDPLRSTRHLDQILSHHLDYWKQQLAGELPILNLPTDYPRPKHITYQGARQQQVFSPALTQGLKILSQQQGVTLYMTLLSAFKTLLYRYTGQTDLIVGSPIAQRHTPQLDSVIGFFVNTLVLRTQLSGKIAFTDLLQTVRQTALDAYTHCDLPFEQLVQQLQPTRELSHRPLFDVMFVLQNMPMLQSMPSGLRGNYEELDTGTAKFDLTLLMEETEAGLQATVEYNTALFKAETITRMLGHFQTLLEGVVSNPHQSINRLPLLTTAEVKQIHTWNQTQVDYPLEVSLPSLIEAQVERNQDVVGLVVEGDTTHSLSYRELNAKANQLAHYLQEIGVKSDVLVGVCLERSVEMVIALLAIVKAGGAYLPLDPTYPQERLTMILEDAKPLIVITQSNYLTHLPQQDNYCCFEIVEKTLVDYSTHNPNNHLTPESLAYTIYTSGSTGTPKGAMNTHQAIVNRLLWMQEAYNVEEDDRILQKTPFSFDVSVWEFFLPLISGAQLILARPEGHKDPVYLQRLIQQHDITMLHFVPSMLQVFLATETLPSLPSLKRVICSGEALAVELQNRFLHHFPNVELHNLYGPTEAAIDVTAWACHIQEEETIVPIGQPIANTQIYLLDSHQQLVPVGIPGELHIGGVGLARGYLNRPELTAEKFIPNLFQDFSTQQNSTLPLTSSLPLLTETLREHYSLRRSSPKPPTLPTLSTHPSQRLYKTGDLARYRADGAIEFLGRLDHQVKLRGFRIELGEIESLLRQYPGVEQAVVITREDTRGDQQLVGYVVLDPNLTPRVADLRQFLRKQLPEYMIPAGLVVLETLPLNANGKVDRRRLPALEQPQESDSAYTAPQTALEETITDVWQHYLKQDRIGIYDNFFDLGGHSLLLVQVHQELLKKLNVNLDLVTLFEHSTINSLAHYLQQESTDTSSLQNISQRAQKRKAALNRRKKYRGH